ncbi:hypothetical protein [Actinoplanes sp. NPDC026619]
MVAADNAELAAATRVLLDPAGTVEPADPRIAAMIRESAGVLDEAR